MRAQICKDTPFLALYPRTDTHVLHLHVFIFFLKGGEQAVNDSVTEAAIRICAAEHLLAGSARHSGGMRTRVRVIASVCVGACLYVCVRMCVTALFMLTRANMEQSKPAPEASRQKTYEAPKQQQLQQVGR